MYYIYILTNHENTVYYIGVTNNLERRIFEHKEKLVEGFTKKYSLSKLVFFEETDDIFSAIAREKQIKKYRREKKEVLIESINPYWRNLSEELFEHE